MTDKPDKPAQKRTESREPAIGTHRVRISMQPDELLEVDDAEHRDLESQGLLVESSKPDARLRNAPGEGK